jgi:tRNA (adenine22-N1)-methyltransferase
MGCVTFMKDTKQDGAGVKLSRRLSALGEWVPEGARYADIGTDHALLPVFLTYSGRVRYAVAGDIHAGPLEAARRQVADANVADRVFVRLGDGLKVLSPGEVDTVNIAGMGGSLMARLLTEAGERLDSVKTLVLSPHGSEDTLRRWLADNGFVLDREALLEEDGITYTLMRAYRAESADDAAAANRMLYDEAVLAPCRERVALSLLYEMGPCLIREASRVFRSKWEQEIEKREKIVRQMKRSETPDAADKVREWERAIADIREVLSCLPAEKRSSNG